MKRSQGPTKRRAPSRTAETPCPHSFIEDEGMNLEIECGSCSGAHDLANAKCLGGVMLALIGGACPESIVLKRAIHKRYRGEAVRSARGLANLLADLSRALSGVDAPSDKTCRTCPARKDRIISILRSNLLRNPLGTDLRTQCARDIMEELGPIRCEKALGCVNEALSSVNLRSGGI